MKILPLLLLVICVGLFLRLDAAWSGAENNMPDSVAYERIARGVATEGKFVQDGTTRWTQPASNYSPGVPLLLGSVFYLTGSEDPRLARILLALLAAGAIPITFLLARQLAGPWAGLLAASLVAFYPTLVSDSGMILTEGLAGTLLAGALFFAFRPQKTTWTWVSAGSLFAAAAIVRPDFLLVALVVGVVLWWQTGGMRPALLLASMLLVIAPWSAYITAEKGEFVPISTGGGQVLFTGSYLPTKGNPQNLAPELIQQKPNLLRSPLIQQSPPPPGQEVPTDQLLVALALQKDPSANPNQTLSRLGREQYLRALGQPLELGTFMVQKFYNTWLRGRASLTSGWAGHLLHLLIVALAAAGLILVRRKTEWGVLLAITATVTLLALLLVASPRRILAIWPVVATLAGAGAVMLLGLLETLRAPPASRTP